MPNVSIYLNDAAVCNLMNGQDSIYKTIEFATQAEADAAEAQLQGEGDPVITMPDQSQKPLTRGEVLYWLKVGKIILVLLLQMRGIPVPF